MDGLVTLARCLSRRQLLWGSLALTGLGLLSACGIVGLPAQQPARIPRIGFLAPGPREYRVELVEAFQEGLRDHGYVEGQTITVVSRISDRDEQLAMLAAELIQSRVDVVVTVASVATRAVKGATTSVPVVFHILGDPVAGGFVASLAQPGSNLTGVTGLSPGLTGKRLELLKEAIPNLARVGYIWSSAQVSETEPEQFQERHFQEVARALGIQVQQLDVKGPGDLEDAFVATTAWRADALLVAPLPLMSRNRTRIFDFAASRRLPAMYGARDYVEAGGLMCYAANSSELPRRLATYVDKILKGAKPADLPVEQPTKFDFVINLKTAQGLGLTIPQSVLQQATEVIP
jgi:putative ABC transport system substrate-binding protein